MGEFGMLPEFAYERAIGWARRHLLEEFGVQAAIASPTTDRKYWCFYGSSGELCAKIEDDLIQRLARVQYIWAENGDPL
jgi:hypothetical protein